MRVYRLACWHSLLSHWLFIDERVKNFDLCRSVVMSYYVRIVNLLFVTSLLQFVCLFVFDDSHHISHFTAIAYIYQTFEGFTRTQTEILLPKCNPSVACDALVIEIFFFDFPGHTMLHGCKNIFETSLIKLVLLFILELVKNRSQIVDSILRNFNIFA